MTVPCFKNHLRIQLRKISNFVSSKKPESISEVALNSCPKDWATRGRVRLEILKKAGLSEPYPNFTYLEKLDNSKHEVTEASKTSFSSGFTLNSTDNQSNHHSSAEDPQFLLFNDVEGLKEKYSELKPGEKLPKVQIVLAGRVLFRRDVGSKLTFYSLLINHSNIQIVVNKRNFILDTCNDKKIHICRGDIVRFKGFVGRTQTGELSVFAISPPEVLAPCLIDLPMPNQLSSLDAVQRRALFLLHHKPTHQAIKIRSQVLKVLRNFLDGHGFIEVETPILTNQVGGASARPFITKCNALDDLPLFLRIAPELYLKQMIIGGFDRVYEIGRVFRNEGIDATHNPEFTTCEFYVAYANLQTLFDITEKLLQDIVLHTMKSLKIPAGEGKPHLDFSLPFKKINVIEELEKKLNHPLPDFYGPVQPYIELCQKHKITISPPHTITRILDQLIEHFIQNDCYQPTFLYGHPLVMSPLAKASNTGATARFELFIKGKEYINAYEELNVPHEQLSRFLDQSKDRECGDLEAHPLDQIFCEALAYGMPPTAGWGLGIDRLIALLSQASNLRTILSFPLSRPNSSQPIENLANTSS